MHYLSEKQKEVKVSSTPNGRSKVKDAANIHKDVLNRLSISECSSFAYHVTNECYKGCIIIEGVTINSS